MASRYWQRLRPILREIHAIPAVPLPELSQSAQSARAQLRSTQEAFSYNSWNHVDAKLSVLTRAVRSGRIFSPQQVNSQEKRWFVRCALSRLSRLSALP